MNEISIKIPTVFATEVEKKNLNFSGRKKKIAEAILNKRTTLEVW